jgi:soluble lytic murein transglycosylase-like protein
MKRVLGIVTLVLSMGSLPGISLAASEDDRAALAAYLSTALTEDNGFQDRFDAEVWLVDMQQRLAPLLPDSQERLDLLTQVHQQASQLDLPPELVLAVIEVESHFDRYAVSRVGAQGLMQVMPFWKNELGRPEDNLTDTATNLRYGCHILRFYLDREDQQLTLALAAYNGSSGSERYPNKVRDAWQTRWRTQPIDW